MTHLHCFQTYKGERETALILWLETCNENRTAPLMLKQRSAERPALHNMVMHAQQSSVWHASHTITFAFSLALIRLVLFPINNKF